MPKDDTISELRKKEEEDLARILAQKHGLTYLDLSRITIDLDSLKIIPEETARANSVAVIQSVGKKLQVALTNPERPAVKEVLENLKAKKYEPQLFLVSPSGLEKALSKYKEIPRFEEIKAGIIDISPDKLAAFAETAGSFEKFKEAVSAMAREKEAKKASDALELILAGALGVEASDVHIEPSEKTAKIRLRMDGVLQDAAEIPLPLFSLLLSRIKLISELKLNIHDKPQDGRFTIKTQKEDIEVRTSALPGPYGESVVMRLLLPKTISITFDGLGMQPPVYKMMKGELVRPNGMILTTGPTGSGKTTTLYSFLKTIASQEVKVITIEDPIEYHLPNITQTQVDPAKGYDFGNGLRSILRQDPDIILVGEIRDLETAEIAMHAALTGHLVFSTLHTNDAAGTIPRLIDLGVKTNIISPALNLVIAQRLVRILCKECKIQVSPSVGEKRAILKTVSELPPSYKELLPPPPAGRFKIWKAAGCAACNGTGFKGRIGIFEAFLIDNEMERLIIKNPPKADIEEAAKKQGMATMYQDGALKVLDGITSFEELNRVVSEE
ncbi:MAG: type II/IV secretion system protein [Candidatus Giovannonibacteria bacterium]|nr:MAG: type II/IV secretion system protein [Candidatus Giovannonibacteria bacterium]